MKKLGVVSGVLGLCILILGVQVEAQVQPVPPPVSGSPMAVGKGGARYNPSTVVTVAGTIAAIDRMSPKRTSKPANVRLTLQTPQGPVMVLLGPADYVEQQPVRLAVGDPVEVTGSQASKGRKARIIAAQVRKGNEVLQLRDPSGRPLWRGVRGGM